MERKELTKEANSQQIKLNNSSFADTIIIQGAPPGADVHLLEYFTP
jgi:hypothetical protein